VYQAVQSVDTNERSGKTPKDKAMTVPQQERKHYKLTKVNTNSISLKKVISGKGHSDIGSISTLGGNSG